MELTDDNCGTWQPFWDEHDKPGRQAQRSSETLEQNCADDDGTTTPARLDLTGCRNTTPTDIMKRARKTQRHLFPHLAPLGAKSAAKVADGNRKDLLTLQQAEIEPAEGAHCRAGRGKRVLARAAGRGDDMRLLPKKEPGRELVPLDDVIGNLPFIVRRDHRIVAAFFQESRGP